MIPFKIQKKIREGEVYAVQTGDYVGEMWTFVRENNKNYEFLSTPKMENRTVTKEKFDFGKENAIIEYVETIPRDIFKVVQKQFEVNRKRLQPS